MPVDGVLVVDKPAGPTSHDVVARVRRAIQIGRIGHTGTLDPLATGVLPLVIGRATRLAQFLTAEDKEYIAEVRFGATSATYDAEGPLTPGPDPERCTMDAIVHALDAFRGTFRQTPPPFSAKKVGGTRAYKLARRQEAVDVQPVEVTVSELDLLGFEAGVASLRVVSSSGFYVRSLAHDLGQAVGSGAYLASLRRTRAGVFTETDAVPLDWIEANGPAALERMAPMHRLLPELPGVRLTASGLRRTAHGNMLGPADVVGGIIPTADAAEGGRVRLLGEGGELLAIAVRGPDAALHPVIVLM